MKVKEKVDVNDKQSKEEAKTPMKARSKPLMKHETKRLTSSQDMKPKVEPLVEKIGKAPQTPLAPSMSQNSIPTPQIDSIEPKSAP